MDATIHRENVSDNRPHTPGPWRANGYLIEGPQMALSVAVAYPTSDKPGYAARSENEARGNARLIAAAPALLVALENLVRWHATGNQPPIASDWSKAREAIAKARV